MAGAGIRFDDRVEVPTNLRSLGAFRDWMTSGKAPEIGRFDFISGDIEIETSPEDLTCHGIVKSELHLVIGGIVKSENLGQTYVDRARFSSVPANLSVEPDIAFVSWESLRSERLRMVPKASQPDHFIEFEGAPDLVVEIVSDASANKDSKRLPKAYFSAGAEEFWLVDARKKDLAFQIHTRGVERFKPVAADTEGFQRSGVLRRSFRLDRHRGPLNHWVYDLRHRAED